MFKGSLWLWIPLLETQEKLEPMDGIERSAQAAKLAQHTWSHVPVLDKVSLCVQSTLMITAAADSQRFCTPVLTAVPKYLHNLGKDKATQLLGNLASHREQSSMATNGLRGWAILGRDVNCNETDFPSYNTHSDLRREMEELKGNLWNFIETLDVQVWGQGEDTYLRNFNISCTRRLLNNR